MSNRYTSHGGGGGGGGHIIENNGSVFPQEAALNFINNNLVVTDNPGNGSTDVQIIPGGSDQNIQWNHDDGSGTPFIDGNSNFIWDRTNNRLGLFQATPTAKFHIGAGSTSANTAPLKFTSGSVNSTPEPGAVEWTGSRLSIVQTSGSTRQSIAYLTDFVEFTTETNVTGTTANMTVQTIHRANNASLVSLTLPTSSNVGDKMRVVGVGAGGWRIAQNASQLIIWNGGGVAGTNQTTTGTGGRLDSNDQYDMIEMECTTASTTWQITASKGNISIT